MAEYDSRDRTLERLVRRRFELDQVAVNKTVLGGTAADGLRSAGHFGVPFVADVLPARSIVAFAGGRIIRHRCGRRCRCDDPGWLLHKSLVIDDYAPRFLTDSPPTGGTADQL